MPNRDAESSERSACPIATRSLRSGARDTSHGLHHLLSLDAPGQPGAARAIHDAVRAHNTGRTWLSCEPVDFFDNSRDGHLFGGSKPNFLPEDEASAAQRQLPDGTVRDLVDILCRLSTDFDVDWEFSHDYDPGPIGFIRDGVADDRLMQQMETFADLPSILDDMRVEIDEPHDDEDWEDDEPPILPFRSRD